ncbi:MAG: hypothetical protein QNL62_20755 [Gammaproteobacteria bacterium]|nr:hypothetical protein [Gammaproteobacteria bacterium]
MDQASRAGIDYIASKITDYFRKYPNAADTADGVFKWWLSREQVRCTHEQVESALECLIEEGVVTKTILSDGRTLYSCKKADGE